jgi:Ca2+-binding RTX toxin-like protein
MRNALLLSAVFAIATITVFAAPAVADHEDFCFPSMDVLHVGPTWTGDSDWECVGQNTTFSNDNNWNSGYGTDIMFSGPGSDILQGGVDGDWLFLGSGADEFADGGNGPDSIGEYRCVTSCSTADICTTSGVDDIRGGNGDDIVRVGGGAADYARGEDGNDTVYHMHDGSEADDLGGFETHVHSTACP